MTENNKKESMIELFNRDRLLNIYVSEEENSSVHIAVGNLIKDINTVSGCKVQLSKEVDKCSMVIGTLGASKGFAEIIHKRKLSIDKLKKDSGDYHWEGFLQEVVDNVLYIVGTDRRGTIFGIYDLCEEMGVSPWYYWADVPVKTKEVYSIPAAYLKVDWPSVKYRGIFINDEEELNDWSKLHTPDGTIGPTTYAHMFELLLRLKANYIWPAMHVNYFNENIENGALAERMGVVVGTSHCDMLLRSNQNEWKPWIKSKGYLDAVYDYSIEGRNREILKEYWRESVEQNKDYEAGYTMGMRGIHDSGFHTKTIDENHTLTEEEKKAAKVTLLGEVIKAQRQILKDVLGDKKGEETLQTFVPYKEVLELYNRGLEVPEDITLIWANDNFGHMRRYPNENERKRKGGHGLYFHSSYWAAPGTAMSYLFINSIPLAQTGNELKKSYATGIRNIWVLNVGGLKPVEQDMEFFLRYGWDAGKDKAFIKDVSRFTEEWINSNFSGNHGAEAAELYNTFARVTNVRKIEHMNSNVFSQTAYGDEAGRRLMKLEDIFRRGNEILVGLPEEERIGFFQLFLMKIHASYYTNLEYYYGDRSVLSYNKGNMQAADHYVYLSEKMTDIKRRMLHFYNKKMSDGKWDKILTPESFPPPSTAMHPAKKPALKIDGSGLRIDLWNEEEIIKFSVYGQKSKWIELGNQGIGNIPYYIELGETKDWLSVSDAEGIVLTEKRILISVKEPLKYAGRKGNIIISDLRNNRTISVTVQVEVYDSISDDFTGYVEADGYVSMPAEGYQSGVSISAFTVSEKQKGWLKVPGMGRYEGSAMVAWNGDLCSLSGKIQQNPYLAYRFYLQNEGNHILELFRFLTLDSLGSIRLGIAIDDGEPFIVESKTCDEWTGTWQQSVFDNGEKMLIELPHLTKGVHTLKIYMIDNFVTITKMVIYTRERKDTNLGPAFSMIHNVVRAEYGLESPCVNLDELEQLGKEFYLTEIEEVPLLDVLYAPKKFFASEQIFNKCLFAPQKSLGVRKYDNLLEMVSKKDIFKDSQTGAFIESEGTVAFEAEYALENSDNAYLTESKEGRNITWSHLLAETCGRTGLVMHVEEPRIMWEEASEAPGMHYKINITNAGEFHVWLLLRHYNNKSDSCYFGLDGTNRPIAEQFGKGKLHTYNTSQVYYWCHMTDMNLTVGEHVFSILARMSELRIDRIYLTKDDKLPPIDANWVDALRK
jgi:hypothetical protein